MTRLHNDSGIGKLLTLSVLKFLHSPNLLLVSPLPTVSAAAPLLPLQLQMSLFKATPRPLASVKCVFNRLVHRCKLRWNRPFLLLMPLPSAQRLVSLNSLIGFNVRRQAVVRFLGSTLSL